MNDLMIDIETMGNTHDAAMIQLAAVYFDPETGEKGETFNRCIDLNDVTDHGFTVNDDTKEWWVEDDEAVYSDHVYCMDKGLV